LPKKIQIHLLLADLALQLGDPLARRINALWPPCRPRRGSNHHCFPRPTLASQSFGTAGAKVGTPKIQILAPNQQLPRKGAHILARYHPANRR
jgi:hypothetical protein